ncbi:MAG: hypothetical protein HUK18_01155 [Bacteroidales bacterium]|nr:hypothetical protein [Bacteroidales bacterium]
MKKLLCLILSFNIVVLSFAQQTLNGKSDKTEYMIGDRIEYSFSIPLPKENVVVSTEYKFSDTINLISQKSDTNNGKINYHFTFASFVEGNINLPQYTIYKHSGAVPLYVVNAGLIRIKTPAIDTINIEVKPLKDIIKTPITFKETLPFGIGVIVVALLVFAIIYYLKHRKTKETKIEKREKHPPIAEDIEALNALNALRAEHYIEKNQTKLHYISLTDILWKYIFRRFNINAFEMTSGEIITALQKTETKEENIKTLKEIFETADYVKFAKHIPSDVENLRIMESSVSFINATKRQTIEDSQNNKEEKI